MSSLPSTSSSAPEASSTSHLRVSGMSCGACVRRVDRALRANPAVKDVLITLETGEASIQHDGSLTPTALAALATNAGYPSVPRAHDDQGSPPTAE
jgi:P-type Cu+ transporter